MIGSKQTPVRRSVSDLGRLARCPATTIIWIRGHCRYRIHSRKIQSSWTERVTEIAIAVKMDEGEHRERLFSDWLETRDVFEERELGDEVLRPRKMTSHTPLAGQSRCNWIMAHQDGPFGQNPRRQIVREPGGKRGRAKEIYRGSSCFGT